MPSRRQVLASLGAVGVGSAAGCLASVDQPAHHTDEDTTTDWPLPDFDHWATSYNPNPDAGPTGPVTRRWDRDVPAVNGRPVVADGTVFVPTWQSLLALDAGDGTVQWKLGGEEGNRPSFSAAAVVDGTVYVNAGSDGETEPSLRALDAETGDEQWRVELRDSVWTPPAVSYLGSDPRLIFTGDAWGTVYAVDRQSGKIVWTRDLFSAIRTLAVKGGLFVGTAGGEVYALNEQDGRGRWRQKLGAAIEALSCSQGGSVYAGTFGGAIRKLGGGLHAGTTRWESASVSAQSALVYTGQTVYANDGTGLVAANYRTGETEWTAGDDLFCTPAAAGDTFYVGGGTTLYAYKLGGGLGVDDVRFAPTRWTTELDGAIHQVTVADGAVFAASDEGSDGRTAIYAVESA